MRTHNMELIDEFNTVQMYNMDKSGVCEPLYVNH